MESPPSPAGTARTHTLPLHRRRHGCCAEIPPLTPPGATPRSPAVRHRNVMSFSHLVPRPRTRSRLRGFPRRRHPERARNTTPFASCPPPGTTTSHPTAARQYDTPAPPQFLVYNLPDRCVHRRNLAPKRAGSDHPARRADSSNDVRRSHVRRTRTCHPMIHGRARRERRPKRQFRPVQRRVQHQPRAPKCAVRVPKS